MPTTTDRRRRPRSARAFVPFLPALLFALAACGGSGDEPAVEDLESEVETLLMTQSDYPQMTKDEFVSELSRRVGAMLGILDHLVDHDPSSEAAKELETQSLDFQQRLFGLKAGYADDPQSVRAQLAKDAEALQTEVIELAHEHVGTRLK